MDNSPHQCIVWVMAGLSFSTIHSSNCSEVKHITTKHDYVPAYKHPGRNATRDIAVIAATLIRMAVITLMQTPVKKYRHGLQAANNLPSFLWGVLLCKVVPLLSCKPSRPKVRHLHTHTQLEYSYGEGVCACCSPGAHRDSPRVHFCMPYLCKAGARLCHLLTWH